MRPQAGLTVPSLAFRAPWMNQMNEIISFPASRAFRAFLACFDSQFRSNVPYFGQSSISGFIPRATR